MKRVENYEAYQGYWLSRNEFVLVDFKEFKHLVGKIKHHSKDNTQWVLTEVESKYILQCITNGFRFSHNILRKEARK